MKKVITLFLFVSLFSSNLEAQKFKKGVTYQVKVPISCVEFFDNICSSSENKFGICKNTNIEIIKYTSDNSKVVFKIIDGFKCKRKTTEGDTLDYAKEGSFYCANEDKIEVVESRIKLNVGPLAVPFKFKTDGFDVYPAGAIGFYVGPKFLSKKDPDNYFSIIGSGGFSQVPLNNTNSANAEDTKTVTGASAAAGAVYNFGKDYQIGLIGGVDFFNADGEEKTRSWISFTVGITLLGERDSEDTVKVVK